MVLYIDETENEEFFIVAGLLAETERDVETAYSKFKKAIRGLRISEKAKSQVYTEFKSTLIDKNYYRVKEKMLSEISDLKAEIIFSCYKKRSTKLSQIQKEAVYITLLSNILASLDEKITDVVFDRFGITEFEERIKKLKQSFSNVSDLQPHDSQTVHGLQFADNICSTIRHKKSNDDPHDYYKWIEKITCEV